MFDKVVIVHPFLNIPGFWILWDSEHVSRMTEGSFMRDSEYVWMDRNMWEYAWICLNGFFYVFPFPHLFYNPVSTCTLGHLFECLEVIVRRNMFFWGNKINFFYGTWKGWGSWGLWIFRYLLVPFFFFKKSRKS